MKQQTILKIKQIIKEEIKLLNEKIKVNLKKDLNDFYDGIEKEQESKIKKSLHSLVKKLTTMNNSHDFNEWEYKTMKDNIDILSKINTDIDYVEDEFESAWHNILDWTDYNKVKIIK